MLCEKDAIPVYLKRCGKILYLYKIADNGKVFK
jgi:hypothetical protein